MKEETKLMIRKRLSWALLFFISLFFLPWYIPGIILLVFTFMYPYKEAFFYGFLIDLLYSPKEPLHMRCFFLGLTIICYFTFRYVRRFVRTDRL